MDTEQALIVLHNALEDYCENNIRSDKEARKELDQAWNKLNLDLKLLRNLVSVDFSRKYSCLGLVKVKTFFGEKSFLLTHVWYSDLDNFLDGKPERIWCRDMEFGEPGVEYKFKYDEEPFEIGYMTHRFKAF